MFLKAPTIHKQFAAYIQKDNAAKSKILCLLKRPFGPALRANPYPEVTDLFCRLPLSTLFYKTRGYTPWRPDAVMSTPRGESILKNSHLMFQGLSVMHQTIEKVDCFPNQRTLSPTKSIPG